jgi:cysteine-S-conjugate beta-lyase
MKTETLVTTLGRTPDEYEGMVNTPVYRTSTVLFKTLDDFESCEKGNGVRPLVYGRSGTPSTRALEEALARLDGADHAILTSSGQSAIIVLMTSMLSSGGHVLVPDSAYGSMRKYCSEELGRFGVDITYYDPRIGAGIAELIRPNTQLVYSESPGSQTFEMQDIPAIATAAHAKNIPVATDNTWATPLFQNTGKLGADITIHSCTKYISGHADILMGLITCSAKFHPRIRRTFRNLGVCPGSEEVYLCARGLRTLSVRLKQHQETALTLAKWLSQRPEVTQVLYPALPSDAGHALWKRDCTGATGLFSIVLKPYPRKALAAMLDNMQLFGMGFSWGGFESLMIPFTVLRTSTPSWKPAGPALRISAGLEHADDLIADLEAGFKRLAAAS